MRDSWRIPLLLVLIATTARADAPDAPNILLIYADDLGYGDVGCYGAGTIPTPSLDRLAEGGLRFTSGYCSSGTCTPSRYTMLTGEYAWRTPGTGIAPPNSSALIRPGTPTIASQLAEAGYRTGIVGKWHLGLGDPPKPDWSGEIKPGPMELGFQTCFIMPTTNDRVPCVYVRGHRIEGMDPADPVDVFNKNPDGQPTGVTHRDKLKLDWSHGHNSSIVNGISRIGFMTGGYAARWTDETMGDVFLREARAFLTPAADEPNDQPFFLFFSAHQIHVPRAPNLRFVGATPHGARADAIVEFDWIVGQLVKKLEQHGLLENTLILVTSDNGPVLDDGYQDEAVERIGDHKPAGPLRGGKYTCFEGGTRVPWIVHWPRRAKSGVSDAIVSQVDLFATFAAAAGCDPLPANVASDSQNVLPAIVGDSAVGREHVVEHTGSRVQLSLRKGPWKYFPPGPDRPVGKRERTAGGPKGSLYNLDTDIGEQHDVAEEHPEIARELAELLEKIRQTPGAGQPAAGRRAA